MRLKASLKTNPKRHVPILCISCSALCITKAQEGGELSKLQMGQRLVLHCKIQYTQTKSVISMLQDKLVILILPVYAIYKISKTIGQCDISQSNARLTKEVN